MFHSINREHLGHDLVCPHRLTFLQKNVTTRVVKVKSSRLVKGGMLDYLMIKGGALTEAAHSTTGKKRSNKERCRHVSKVSCLFPEFTSYPTQQRHQQTNKW
jgi:hypothetical protein